MKAAARPQAPHTMATLSLRSRKVFRPRNTEDCDITSYLEKLQCLVPVTPMDTTTKVTRLSKLEVIEKVIEYIAQLEDILVNKHMQEMDVLECKIASITLPA